MHIIITLIIILSSSIYFYYFAVRVSLVEYLQGDPFRSDHVITQQILSLKTAPEALISQYECTDPKPQLHYFTSLADDGRDAMHLYSNPEFFFNHWRQSMEKEALRRRHLDSMVNPTYTIQTLRHYKLVSMFSYSYSIMYCWI